ncbi:hypothetical protein CEQ90_02575 [Lewinellaceae bacterium SD302]|nr:hypothetical protein CEQ90_02575 [Lewinellaceae bacterium SD302]
MKKNYTSVLALLTLFVVFVPHLSANVLFPNKIDGSFGTNILAYANPAYLGEKVYVLADPGLLEDLHKTAFSGDPTSICVNVFIDYNSNGTDDGAADPPISNVTVTAYDALNAPTVLTVQPDGSYAFTPGNTATYRIEVTGLAPGLEPSTAGATTVAFASQGETVNIALHYPDEYYPDDIFLVVPCYVEGSAAPGGPNVNGDVLVIVPESSLTPGPGTVNPTEYYVADHDEIGATFGVSYGRASNSVFAAAFAKRHAGFGPSGTGAIYKVDLNGDEPTAPISGVGVSTIVDLNALFGPITAGVNPHPNVAATDFDRDPLAYDAVGKVGLGGLAYESNTNTLWTINLADRRLYEIPLGGTPANPTPPALASISTWPAGGDLTDLPGLPGTALSRDTDIRPFAVKKYRGKIYIGLVSTAESTVVFNPVNSTVSNTGDRTQMEGFVYEFDPTTDAFTQLLSFPLNYPREQAIDFCSNNALAEFNPWSPVYDATTFSAVTMATEGGSVPERAYPQPWITDIEFTEDGRMVIGLRDRFADQHGYNQVPPNPLAANDPNTSFTADGAGDVLVASLNTTDNTTFVLENNSTNGVNGLPFGPTLGQGQGEGPGGGEFFYDDRYRPANAPPDNQFQPGCALDVMDMDPPLQGNVREQGHDETSLGGIFNFNGQLNLLTSVYDPLDDWNLPFNNAGIISLSNTTGARNGGNQIYATPTDAGTFAKGNGLGDLEGVSNAAPLEIGNRLWVDTDGDGLQDADENGLNGVLVELYKDDGTGTFFKVAETTTAADAAQGNGIYIFSDDGDANQDWTFSAESEMLPNMNYEVRVDLADAQAVNANIFEFSPQNANGDATNDNLTDINDSDASAIGVIAFTTGEAGENNHGLDVGFRPASCELSITAIDPSCTFDPMTGQSTFAVQVSLSWNSELLPITSDAIEVNIAGQTETTAQLNTATGMTTVNFAGVSGPGYDLVVEANFINNVDCEVIGIVDLIACTPECTDALGGSVFQDLNSNGTEDTGEPGQESVLVEVYECDNPVPVATTWTNANGAWSVEDTNITYPVRVEFSTPMQDFLDPALSGTDNGTEVQFVDVSSCEVDYGVYDPAYCGGDADGDDTSDDIRVMLTCFVNGATDGTGPGDVLVAYDYDETGEAAPDILANKGELGSVWSLAYDSRRDVVYTGAFTKRHVGMGDEGPGAIYQYNFASDQVTTLIDLADFGLDVSGFPTEASRNLGNADGTSRDPATFDLVAKTGLGDIDISEDGQTLYAVSLADKTLYEIDIAGQTVTNTYPTLDPGCENGNWRPFALNVHEGKVYVGGVCDAQNGTSDDLIASVAVLTDNGFAEVLSYPLNYQKGRVQANVPAASGLGNWLPWEDDFTELTFAYNTQNTVGRPVVIHPQPVLSDIEFDVDGSIIMAFFDRTGHQMGINNLSPAGTVDSTWTVISGGDILRAASDDQGFFELEDNGQVGGLSGGVGNQQGPGIFPQNGEFYQGDFYNFTNGTPQTNDDQIAHEETSLGSVALLPGSGEVILTVYDPIDGDSDQFGSGGTVKLSNTDGTKSGGRRVYGITDVGTFGKSNGLGDVEITCPPPALQIGNYAWIDTDLDGIQDACEEPLSNVPVFLYTKDDGGGLTQVAMTTTDAEGNYYFTEGGSAGEIWIDPNGEVLPDTSYLIVFGDAATAPSDTSILVNGAEYAITMDSTGEGNNPFFGDSNAETIDVNGTMLPAICYNTADTTDHTLDVGFIPLATLPASLGNYVWLDENSDGLQDAGEAGIPNVAIVLNDENGDPIDTTYTDANGGYLFPDLDAGDYFVDVDETTLPPGITQTTIFTNIVDSDDEDLETDDGDLGNKDHDADGYLIVLDPGEENLTADFGYNFNPTDSVNNPMNSPTAALGDLVWIDSDGDGVKDPNEIGVSGVELTLTTPGPDGLLGTPDDGSQTTTTNENGFYLFDGLPPGAYTVEVTDDDNASHPVLDDAQYDQTADPDHFATSEADNPDDTVEDDDETTNPVVLGPGDVFLNVDFGYEPEPATVLGSIGNTVWLDADADTNGPADADPLGDGENGLGADDDNNEQPIPGVTVSLISDTDGDGVYDAGEPIIATDLTDENGNYLFEDLPLDDGDGDADYLVWVNDVENVLDNLRNTFDEDGGAGENATGLNDDADMVGGLSAVALNAGNTNDRDQDFGYTPEDQEVGLGAIGDYVWYDANEDGIQDPDESGIEGVTVYLCDLGADEIIGGGDDVIIDSIMTDENGNYLFVGLPVDADGEGYQVKISPTNFQPGQPLEDLANTFDPDDMTTNPDNVGGVVTLTDADPVDLDQDFSYVGDDNNQLGSIGNQVWEDDDADGTYEPDGADGVAGNSDDEAPIAGVTIDLYRDLDGNGELDPGEPRIGTTTTDANGMYLFEDLPLDDYIVNVTDVDGVLAGYWHSNGNQDPTTNGGNDPMDNSKEDAFAATIDNAIPDNLNVDFGYYKDPAALGNYVWIDADRNGLQNDGETGLNGVGIMMRITYADGTEIMLTDTTRNDQVGNPGFYDFRNLLLDEDYRDTLAPEEPNFLISVDGNQTAFTDLGLVPTIADIGGNADDDEDSDNFNGVSARAIQGNQTTAARDPETTEEPIATYDFGVAEEPELCDTNDGCSYLADFETDDMGNPLVAGAANVFVDQPYANLYGPGEGLRFSTNDQANHPLNLYNTDGTGGADPDLERNSAGTNQWDNGNIITEMLGNVLIINQTADISQPNDFAGGGDLIVNSDLPLGRFAFDLIDLEPANLGSVTFASTLTGGSVTIPFSDFEAGSGSTFEVDGVVFGDRTANRIISVTADSLGLPSFDSIVFNLPSQSGAIGVICATVNQKFDLALVKRLDTLANPGPFTPGSTITYELEVYNQGEDDAVDIVVSDYVPAGLTLAPASMTDWMVDVDTVRLIDSIDLVAGDSTSLSISFVIDIDFMGDSLVNRAEITYFDDDGDPNTIPPEDFDSTPNDNGDDDPEVDTPNEYDDENPGSPGDMDDPNDEDDYDWEGIPVMQSFDLNLVKYLDTLATPPPYTYGSTVTFAIEVRNQGTLDATDVEVADYVPEGLTLVADANWMMDMDTARTTMPFDLAAGDTATLSISFTIDLDFEGTSITNLAEITAGENALGLPDDDSTPGDNGNTPPDMEIDDEDSDDGQNGDGTPDNPTDADDFDLALLSIETASLGSTVFLDNNNDGLQSGADNGIPMIEVQLFDAMTMMPVLTDAAGVRVLDAMDVAPTLTDGSGNYHFTNLLPGDYYVVIPTTPMNAPISSNNTGIAFVETDPDDNTDNDDEGIQAGGSGTAVTSGTITLSLGDEPENGTGVMDESAQGNLQDDAFDSNGNMTLDFGFFAPVSVGDTAFVDLDESDTQTPGDGVLEGVTVVLLDVATGDTITVDAEGNPISGITMTAADGSYSFTNLPPGDYQVSFDISTANDAEFYAFVTPDLGGDDAVDSDATPINDSTGVSAPTGFLSSGTDDPTLDAGVICTTSVTLAPPATICSTQRIVLNEGASITPVGLGGTWSTPDGTGTFDNGTDFATATTYTTSDEDAARGSVTLILTTNEPGGPCGIVTEQVTFQILRVDCGSFFWNGGN